MHSATPRAKPRPDRAGGADAVDASGGFGVVVIARSNAEGLGGASIRKTVAGSPSARRSDRILYNRVTVAALDTPRARSAGSLRAALPVALPFAAYAALLATACLAVPYRPALDDPEIQFLARHWAEHGRLAPDGLFLRVPLWQMLVGSANAILGERVGIVALQGAVVFAALCLFARRTASS